MAFESHGTGSDFSIILKNKYFLSSSATKCRFHCDPMTVYSEASSQKSKRLQGGFLFLQLVVVFKVLLYWRSITCATSKSCHSSLKF